MVEFYTILFIIVFDGICQITTTLNIFKKIDLVYIIETLLSTLKNSNNIKFYNQLFNIIY